MLDKSSKNKELLISILDFLKRKKYNKSYEKLQEQTNIKFIEQDNQKIEELVKSDKLDELIMYINNSIQNTNQERMYYIKIIKINYFLKKVVNNCINNKNQKDALDYLRTELSPLLNEESNEFLSGLTYILFIKDVNILKNYIKSTILDNFNDNYIIKQLCSKRTIPLEHIYDSYKEKINNMDINLDNYSTLNIQDNCFTPFKPSEVWFLEISKNKNYIFVGFANSNISVFQIIKELNNNKKEIIIRLFLTFSANENNKRDEITAITFSNDEKYILVGLSNYKLKIFELTEGEKIKEYQNIHSNKITSIIPFPNSNNKFITGSIDKKIKILDISNINNINNKNFEEYTELGNFCRIKQLCYSETLNYLIIISASNNELIIYSIINKKIEYKIISSEGSQNIYANLSKKDKGKYLIYSNSNQNNNQKIILYNLANKLVEEKYSGFSQKYMIIKCCFCSTEDNYILSGSEDYSVYVWKRGFGESPRYKFQGHFGIVNTIDMWENDFIISGSDDKNIKVWYEKSDNIEIKYEKNNENKHIIKEKQIDKEFFDAMNDEEDENMDTNMFLFHRAPRMYFHDPLENIEMEVEEPPEDEENENEAEEDDYSEEDI